MAYVLLSVNMSLKPKTVGASSNVFAIFRLLYSSTTQPILPLAIPLTTYPIGANTPDTPNKTHPEFRML